MQHGIAGEMAWMPVLSMLICLQQGLFSAVLHAPKIEDWHANPDAGCKATRPSDSAKIRKARIELRSIPR